MAPDKSTSLFGPLGYIMGMGIIAKVANSENINWKWVVGVAGVIIGLLLTVVGVLALLGINSTLNYVKTIDERQVIVQGSVANLRTEVAIYQTRGVEKDAAHEANLARQESCISRIEDELKRMKGVKMPRLGGGDLGER